MPGRRKLRKSAPCLRSASLMEPFGALADAKSLKDIVGASGLEPQTSTVSTSPSPQDPRRRTNEDSEGLPTRPSWHV
jgi:hypothetical protein